MTYIPPHLRSQEEKDRLLYGSNIKKLNGTQISRSKPLIRESDIHTQVCKYLKAQYPKVIFLSDFGAGMKMTKGMANRQAMQKSAHAFPDLMIFEPRNGYHGLFIELKRDSSSLYTKQGHFKKSDHIDDQIECLHELNERGYRALFACGLDEAVRHINEYLNPNNFLR